MSHYEEPESIHRTRPSSAARRSELMLLYTSWLMLEMLFTVQAYSEVSTKQKGFIRSRGMKVCWVERRFQT